MMRSFSISLLMVFAIFGCRSNPPEQPSIDRCLGLHTVGLAECSPPTSMPVTMPIPTPGLLPIMLDEITYRLQEIGSLLTQEPMTKGVFYQATAAIGAHGVGISHEYKDWKLRTLLFELEHQTPSDTQSYIRNIRDLSQEMEQLGPEAPFSDAEPADPENVQLARELFKEIESNWQRFLEKSKRDK